MKKRLIDNLLSILDLLILIAVFAGIALAVEYNYGFILMTIIGIGILFYKNKKEKEREKAKYIENIKRPIFDKATLKERSKILSNFSDKKTICQSIQKT